MNTPKDWEAEFDRMFVYEMTSRPVDILGLGEDGANQMLHGKIKSFIRSLLASERAKIREEIGTFLEGEWERLPNKKMCGVDATYCCPAGTIMAIRYALHAKLYPITNEDK